MATSQLRALARDLDAQVVQLKQQLAEQEEHYRELLTAERAGRILARKRAEVEIEQRCTLLRTKYDERTCLLAQTYRDAMNELRVENASLRVMLERTRQAEDN